MVREIANPTLEASTADPQSGEPLEVGYASQLFVDDHLVAHRRSVHRRLNRPVKGREPFLVPEHLWEGGSVLYSCVIEEEDDYRLFYKAKNWSPKPDSKTRSTTICVARSEDGLRFEKRPVEGSVHEGSNIVLDDAIDDFTVYKDESEPDPDRRYKLLASRGTWREGLTSATSPDGVSWTWGTPHAVRYFGDRMSYWYDPVRARHVAWSRNIELYPDRITVESTSEDFETWSHPRVAMMPDRGDHPDSQIYGAYAFWYQSVYLAYVEIYEVAHQRLRTELASSRDGLRWSRLCGHDVFLPNGEHGEFDAYWVVPTFNPPVLRDDRLLIHYGGRPDPHVQPGFGHVRPGMGGSLAVSELREDGFVSLDATGVTGEVTSKLLRVPNPARSLAINVGPFNTRDGYDRMQVELTLMDDGLALGSWAIEDDERNVWQTVPLPDGLPDSAAIQFRMKNARLYSFKFCR